VLRALSLALKFGLELAAVAAFAFWGATIGRGVLSVLVAIAAPALAVVLWARFAAPRSKRRLPAAPRIAFEVSVFALAVVALIAAGAVPAAIVLGVLVAASTALLTALDQWEA
jgi:hypothetical protein